MNFVLVSGVAVRENAIGELLLMRLRLSVTQEQSEAVQIQIRETLGLLGYQSPIQSKVFFSSLKNMWYIAFL